VVYRALSWENFLVAVRASVRTTAVVFLLVGTATAFAWLLAMYRLPDILTEGMLAISDNPIVILLLINLCLLVLGCVMDMAALILITTPIFLPVVMAIGMDPVQFGMVMMMNLGLGLTTPPVGAVLFVGCAIGQIRIEHIMKTIIPFWGAILVALALTTYWPAISLTLPRLLLGYGLCFLGVLMAGALLAFVLRKLIAGSGLSGTDRLLGMMFGLARGVLLVLLAVLLLGFTPFPRDPWWRQSQLMPSFQNGAQWLSTQLPDSVGKHLDYRGLLTIPALPDKPAAPTSPPADAAAPEPSSS